MQAAALDVSRNAPIEPTSAASLEGATLSADVSSARNRGAAFLHRVVDGLVDVASRCGELPLRTAGRFVLSLAALQFAADALKVTPTAEADMILNSSRFPGADNDLSFAGTIRSSSLAQAAFTVLNLDGPTRLTSLEFEATLVRRNGLNASSEWEDALNQQWILYGLEGSTPTNFPTVALTLNVAPTFGDSLTGSSLARHGSIDLSPYNIVVDSPTFSLALTMISPDQQDYGLAMALLKGLPSEHWADFRTSIINPAATIREATGGGADGIAMQVMGSAVVPEPNSLFLALLGGGGMLVFSRLRARGEPA